MEARVQEAWGERSGMDGGGCHHRRKGTASLQMETSEDWVVGVRFAYDEVGNR